VSAAGWRAILFDLDGTLADTVPLILACYRHTMRVHGRGELSDERWLATIGRPLHDSLLEFTDDPAERDAMVETYITYQRTVHDSMVRAFPGAGALVEAFGARGAKLAVVTSKRREMALRTLERCGLGGRFAALVTPEDVRRGKPDPEPVRLALARLSLGSSPGAVLFVGDSPYDVAAGRDAGVRTAAATWGPFARARLMDERPDWVVDSLEELLTLAP
jgi:pyrophosphatase PpaX